MSAKKLEGLVEDLGWNHLGHCPSEECLRKGFSNKLYLQM